jgi:hypothetical protein
MRRRRDLRSDEKGYFDDTTDAGVDAGRGFGRSIDNGGDESERRRGRKL